MPLALLDNLPMYLGAEVGGRVVLRHTCNKVPYVPSMRYEMIQPKLRQREYTWVKTYLVVLYIKVLSNQNIVKCIPSYRTK